MSIRLCEDSVRFRPSSLLTESSAAKKVDNMIQNMASQNLEPLVGVLATMASFTVVSLGVCDMLSVGSQQVEH